MILNIRMCRSLSFFAGALILLSSCVTNRKYVYVQKDDVNPSDNQIPLDTALREYKLKPYDYKIQPNDLISVRFESLTAKEFDFLNANAAQNSAANNNISQGNALLIGELVDDNGQIVFPYIGKVKVSDMTVFQIQDTLQSIASQYLEGPIVKVRLLNYRATILGEVNKEGTITFTNNRVTLLEALGLAGGLTDLADKAHIKIIRQINGRAEISYVNVLDENLIHSPYYYIHQNDVLIVAALRQRAYRRYFGQNLALIISSISLVLLTISISQN